MFSDLKISGGINDLESVTSAENINEVIISFNNISFEELFEIIDKCVELNLRIKIASDIFKIIPNHFKTETYFGVKVS